MKLTKENIYINLQGKSKEELTDLWEFLNSNGEKCYRDKDYFIEYQSTYRTLYLYCNLWRGYDDDKIYYKTEVTIQQLKQIIKPMETLQEKAIRLENELNEVKQQIEEENIKLGNWVRNTVENSFYKIGFRPLTTEAEINQCRKITNPELIKLLEQEIK